MRPLAVPAYIKDLRDPSARTDDARIAQIKADYKQLLKGSPLVSVVIPAYNEEKDILPTLQSIAANVTEHSVEIVVVNNNSSDNTEALVRAAGVTCVNEPKPGVTNARNAGLAVAKGKFVINADADTIYPKDWVKEMVGPIANNPDICLTYGLFSFIPTGPTQGQTYFFYESIVDGLRFLKRHFKEEAVNVGGCNSCFRREQGLAVDSFDHPPGANEDGYLALKLRNKGFGKLRLVKTSIVWTTDRRIQMDGGLMKGIVKRAKRLVS